MLYDRAKTRAELIRELEEIRGRSEKLESTLTRYKAIEEALKQSEEKYKAVFDNAFISMVSAALDGTIQLISAAGAKNLGGGYPRRFYR